MMKDLASEVFRLLCDVGAIPHQETPPTIRYFSRPDTDIAFRFGRACEPCPPAVIQACRSTLVRDIEVSGNYINIKLNGSQLAERILPRVESLGMQYGFDLRLHGLRIIVEHTSLNPVYPINVATFRSSAIGNALADLFRGYGARVETRFWIQDQSRHLAVVVRGLRSLAMSVADLACIAAKSDHAIGAVFAATLYKATGSQLANDKDLLNRMFPLAGFEPEIPVGINAVELQLTSDEKDEALAICKVCIGGFNDTFAATDVRIDGYDFESNYLGSAQTSRILHALGDPYMNAVGGPSEQGKRRRGLSYFLRNAIYYAQLLNHCSRVVSVVSARQIDLARASASLAQGIDRNLERSIKVVCFGDVHACDRTNDSVKQGVFSTVDAVLSIHSRELGRSKSVIAAGLKFALLRCNARRTCDLSRSASETHREFLQILKTLARVDSQLAVHDGTWSESIPTDTSQEVTLLKRIAAFPDVLEQVLEYEAYHALARYVLEISSDIRKYLHGYRRAGGTLFQKRILAASRTTLVNALRAMGVKVEAIATRMAS